MDTRTRSAALAAWSVAAVFWLYYMTPFLLPAQRPWHMPAVGAVAGLAAIALLVLRRRWPLPVVLLIGLCLFISPTAIGAGFVLQAVVAVRYGRSSLVALTGGWMLLAKIIQILAGPYRSYTQGWSQAAAVELGITVVGLAIATLIGWLSGSVQTEHASRDDAEAARRDADQARMEQVRLGERARIAREMHDVLAHRISLVAMHSGALAYRDDLDPQTTRETARTIQQNARSALDELRLVLFRLRDEDQAGDQAADHPEPPQPTLAQLPALVAEAQRTGQRVQLEIDGDPDDLAPQAGRSAYRIVQEGLTNARKHAPGAPVEIRIDACPEDQLQIMISNPITGLALPDDTGAGLGLVGVVERVELLGGTTSTRAVGGCFELTATIPAEAAFRNRSRRDRP